MRDDIRKEIRDISAILASVGNANYYKVPDDYFSNLSDEVLSRIRLPHIQIPFTKPEPFYFENFASSVLEKVRNKNNGIEATETVTELKELSPLLAGISKKNVYTVPENYFFSFTVDVTTVKETAKPATVVRPIKWLKYAIAAAITGIIVTGGVLLFNNNTGTGTQNGSAFTKNYNITLSKLSNEAIASYLQSEPEDIDALSPLYDDNQKNSASLTQDLLKNVSDHDIQQYLQENDEPGENDIKGI